MPSPTGGSNPKPFKTSEIKSRILNVAKPTIYMVRLQPPTAVTSFIQQRGINYLDIGEDIELRCFRTSTPATSFLTHAVSADYHGVVEEIPYRRGYENEISMSFYVDTNYDTIEFFEGWVDYMSGLGVTAPRDSYYSSQAFFRMSYYDSYRVPIFLTKFEKDVSYEKNILDTADRKSLEYTFIDAYPKAINSMELSYDSTEALTLDVTFGYSRYVRRRLSVTTPSGSLSSTEQQKLNINQRSTNTSLSTAQQQTGNLDLTRSYLGTREGPSLSIT